jgi:hypothetical protein
LGGRRQAADDYRLAACAPPEGRKCPKIFLRARVDLA